MQIPRAVRYLTAMDVLDAAAKREAAIHESHGTADPTEALPLESGLDAAAEIYEIRLACWAKAAGAIVCRVTGIDAMYRIATNTEFPV